MPLRDEFAAARFSLITRSRDGYVKNEVNSDEYSDDRALRARLQLLVLPRSDMEILFSADQSIEDRKPLGGKCLRISQAPGRAAVPAVATGFSRACDEDAERSEFKTASDVSFAQDALRSYGGSVGELGRHARAHPHLDLGVPQPGE
jgi:hypothetical protein